MSAPHEEPDHEAIDADEAFDRHVQNCPHCANPFDMCAEGTQLLEATEPEELDATQLVVEVAKRSRIQALQDAIEASAGFYFAVDAQRAIRRLIDETGSAPAHDVRGAS